MNSTIIDVRTPDEYALGHAKNSMNIPLQELYEHIEDLKKIQGEIVVCCASGVRSAKAYRILQQNGFEKISNGGPWMDVERMIAHH
ncbi:MAG TPA: rhodanese-like domain-containing protein [Puia sp.]|nr:rhodanese-like domain-containing protein [Puia sp.]